MWCGQLFGYFQRSAGNGVSALSLGFCIMVFNFCFCEVMVCDHERIHCVEYLYLHTWVSAKRWTLGKWIFSRSSRWIPRIVSRICIFLVSLSRFSWYVPTRTFCKNVSFLFLNWNLNLSINGFLSFFLPIFRQYYKFKDKISSLKIKYSSWFVHEDGTGI